MCHRLDPRCWLLELEKWTSTSTWRLIHPMRRLVRACLIDLMSDADIWFWDLWALRAIHNVTRQMYSAKLSIQPFSFLLRNNRSGASCDERAVTVSFSRGLRRRNIDLATKVEALSNQSRQSRSEKAGVTHKYASADDDMGFFYSWCQINPWILNILPDIAWMSLLLQARRIVLFTSEVGVVSFIDIMLAYQAANRELAGKPPYLRESHDLEKTCH